MSSITADQDGTTHKTKLRILCLHGFTSNSQVQGFQLRRLISALQASSALYEYEFLIPDAPHAVTSTEGMDSAWHEFVMSLDFESERIGHRAWWFAKDPDWKNKVDGKFEGIERTFEFLGEWLRGRIGNGNDGGGVDAIWGFSQGGCLAGMLCALLSRPQRERDESHVLLQRLGLEQPAGKLKAGIVFSGFRARFAQYDSIYEPEGIGIPVLNVLGEKDPLVGSERSEALMRVCRKGEVLKFDGGHEIPKRDEDVKRIVDFVRGALEDGEGRDERIQARV